MFQWKFTLLTADFPVGFEMVAETDCKLSIRLARFDVPWRAMGTMAVKTLPYCCDCCVWYQAAKAESTGRLKCDEGMFSPLTEVKSRPMVDTDLPVEYPVI